MTSNYAAEVDNLRDRLSELQDKRERLATKLATMTEVAQGNKRHVASLTAIVEVVDAIHQPFTRAGEQWCEGCSILRNPELRIWRYLAAWPCDTSKALDSASPHGSTSEPGSSRRGRAETVARLFHEVHEDLAPLYERGTREGSAKPWAEVPEPDRSWLIHTCARVIAMLDLGMAEMPLKDSFDQGYAEAVARVRDDDRYRNWWTALPQQDPAYGYWQGPARRHLADYLETVGPRRAQEPSGGEG